MSHRSVVDKLKGRISELERRVDDAREELEQANKVTSGLQLYRH